MKELKCKSCGSNLEIDPKKPYAFCPYCGTKVELNEKVTVINAIGDNYKKIIDAKAERDKKIADDTKNKALLMIGAALMFLAYAVFFYVLKM